MRCLMAYNSLQLLWKLWILGWTEQDKTHGQPFNKNLKQWKNFEKLME